MGQCVYCGENAGWFKKFHQACLEKHDRASAQLREVVVSAAKTSEGISSLEKKIREIATAGLLDKDKTKQIVIGGWKEAVEYMLDDHLLSKEEENRLTMLKEKLNLPVSDLNNDGTYNRMVMGAVLYELMEGKIPSRLDVSGQVPFNLKKNESLIWLFKNTPYYEEKTRRSYEGGYNGVSIRIMKGVYYRTGGFKGNPVETTSLEQIDTGLAGFTNEHIYFAGERKSFRVHYQKIVSYHPYSDGIKIMRDAASAKPQIFATGEGWFVYNLVTNLSRL